MAGGGDQTGAAALRRRARGPQVGIETARGGTGSEPAAQAVRSREPTRQDIRQAALTTRCRSTCRRATRRVVNTLQWSHTRRRIGHHRAGRPEVARVTIAARAHRGHFGPRLTEAAADARSIVRKDLPACQRGAKARVSGRSATASRSIRTSGPSATTTACWSVSGSSTSTPSAASPASIRATCAGRFRWYGLYTQRRQGIPGGRTAILEPEELDDEYFMLRIRIDGGALTSEQLAVDRRDLDHLRPRRRRHHRPAERPAALDPGRGRPGDLGASSRRSACRPPRPAATPRASCSAARSKASPPTACSTPARRCARRSSATSATRRSRTCRASSRPRSRAARGTAPTTRSTTSRSSA